MLKKSNLRIFMIGVLLITLMISVTQIATANSNIIPDKTVVNKKTHSTKIREFLKSNNSQEQIHQYLKGLELKGLLETGAEFAVEGHLINSGVMLSPYVQKKLEQNTSLSEIRQIILDKEYNQVFRAFVLDAVTNSQSIKGYDKSEIVNAILTIASDAKESGYLRRYALLKLRVPHAEATGNNSKLLKILQDNSSPAEVRGAALTAMHRTGDSNFKTAVNKILATYEDYPNEIVRFAVIEAAKSKSDKELYTSLLNQIASETKEQQVYGSTIFSLGIIGGESAVKAILSNYGRFEDTISCDSALKRNYRTIVSMLQPNQSKEIILLGIKAAKSAGLTPALNSLEKIIETSTDRELVKQANEAIKEIKANPASDNYEKWEVE